jgi:hypothetical protein
MLTRLKIIVIACLAVAAGSAVAQDNAARSDKEELQMMALEALMASPSERSLPALVKLLEGDGSDELKENALFVLSQIDHPDTAAKIVSFARDSSGGTQTAAIRMIGINGDAAALAALSDIYATGNADIRAAVLQAYLIADDTESAFKIAMSAVTDEDYEAAVHILAAMDAHAELARLREAKGNSNALIQAYIISDNDTELRQLAMDSSNPALQADAIEALGVVGADGADTVLVDVYTNANSASVKEAALHGLLIGDYDAAVLRLYRASTDVGEKRSLLQTLVVMDSDLATEVIDAALAGDH